MKSKISSSIDLKKFIQLIEGYNFNDKIIAAYFSPFSRNNINMEKLEEVKMKPSNPEKIMSFFVIISGTIELSIDYINYTFSSSSWVELRPTADVKLIDYSNDFMAYLIGVSESFMLDTLLDKKPIPISHFVDIKESPHIKLSNEELTALKMSMDRILHYMKVEHNFKKDMLHNTFYNFVLEASNIFHNRDGVRKRSINLSRKESIIREFMVLVEQNAKTEHNPSFYSDKLCISTQYLSIILKEVTGHTANYWIAKKVTADAKILLRTPNLTIKEITDKLRFADQSSFGKFFKKHTGISPKKYREDFSTPR